MANLFFFRDVLQFCFVAALGICFLPPCHGRPKCEPVFIPICQGLPYNVTIFPNILKHGTQREAMLELNQFSSLVKAECSKDLVFFLCSVYAPACTILREPALPCRSICIRARDDCKELMQEFGFSWPADLSCDRFPNYGEKICVGESPTPTAKRADVDPGKFIDSLELEHRPSSPQLGHSLVLSDGTKKGFVDDGSLVSFASNVTDQQKQDVLYSTLLAQLAANKKYNRFSDSNNWYEFYANVMLNIGWVGQPLHFDEYNSPQADFKISQVTLQLLSAMIDPDMMAVVNATVVKLAQSSKGIALFASNSSSTKSANFQVIPCTIDKSNMVSVAFLGSYLNANTVDQNYFFFTYKKEDIHLFKSTQVLILNEALYSKVRDTVIKKLGDRVKLLIDDLDI